MARTFRISAGLAVVAVLAILALVNVVDVRVAHAELAVGPVLAAGALLPLTREAFRDTRYHLAWGQALLHAMVLIPAGTVLVEEIAFRGVLWGLLRRLWGVPS